MSRSEGTKESDASNNDIVGRKNLFQKEDVVEHSGGGNGDDSVTTFSLSVDLIIKGHYRNDMVVDDIERLIQNVTTGGVNSTQDGGGAVIVLQDLLDYALSRCEYEPFTPCLWVFRLVIFYSLIIIAHLSDSSSILISVPK